MDQVADFNLFTVKVQAMLKTAIPKKLERIDSEEMVTAEIYRNFAYPLLAWETWLDALNIKGAALRKNVFAAKNQYIKDLEKTETKWSAKLITNEAAEKEIRIALARFAFDSKLDRLMEEFLIRNFSSYKDSAGHF